MARDSKIQRASRSPYRKHSPERMRYEKPIKVPGKRGWTMSGRVFRMLRTRLMRRLGKEELVHYPLPSEVKEYFALLES